MSWVNFSVTFGLSLMKITNTCEKVQLELMNGEIKKNIFIDLLLFFTRGKLQWEKRFLAGIYNREFLDPFCIRNSLEIFVKVIIRGAFKGLQCKIPIYFLFRLCNETLSGRDGVSKQKIWTFVILVDECSFGTTVLTIIEM